MLSVQSEGSVLRITLARPEVRNAFNDELIARLTETFRDVGSETRLVVLSGEGKAFCAGGDLEWMKRASSYSREENYADALKLAGLFESVASCNAPVLARVHGACFGGGCGLVAASDIAIADSGALFAFSEVRLGLIAGTISSHVIPKIGKGHARALYATGEAFEAARALAIGLVHQVGDLDELEAKIIKQVLSAGPNAVRESRKIVRDFPLSVDECANRLADIRSGPEAREGVSAFLEKRKASYVEG